MFSSTTSLGKVAGLNMFYFHGETTERCLFGKGFFKRVVSPTAIFETIKAESAEQARDCDDIYLHVHYVYLEPN